MSGITRQNDPQNPYKFTLSTRKSQDFGYENPVSGAGEIVAARNPNGELDLVSIGSEGSIFVFRRDRDSESGWRQERLDLRADRLAAVPQRDGTDKVFYAELTDHSKLVNVYELAREPHGSFQRRQPLGRLATSDPRVYGISRLSGAQDSRGSNILLTTLSANPPHASANSVVVFGKGIGTGALSLQDSCPLAASQAAVCGVDPGQLEWPHITFVRLYEGRLTVEWGAKKGAILHSLPVEVPALAAGNETTSGNEPSVTSFELTRDRSGAERLFALDQEHRLFSLTQEGGGGVVPPLWAKAWTELDTTQPDGTRPVLMRLHAVRRADKALELFAIDAEDRVWSIAQDGAGGWTRMLDLGFRAAHLCTAVGADGAVEVFAVTRQDQLLWLRQEGIGNWRQRIISWQATQVEKLLNLYRTGLTLLRNENGIAPGVPVHITATDRLPMTVNGLSYAVGPEEPVRIETNACGQINVTFEWSEPAEVPTLNFEAEFLGKGTLAVCPARNVQLYMRKPMRHRPVNLDSTTSSLDQVYLIPEDTEVRQP